jgi:hypothetical protein
MGYYPFGKKYFSDLLHYVRSGDFVSALLSESSDINEYAFALGALAHYSSDNMGHPVVNKVVAMEFPKLRAKHGDEVTYADDPKAHIRTEFGFDMVQVAKNRYTSDRYHDFIGARNWCTRLQTSINENFATIFLAHITKKNGEEDTANPGSQSAYWLSFCESFLRWVRPGRLPSKCRARKPKTCTSRA